FVLVVLSAETEGEFSAPVVQQQAGKVRGHIRPVLDNKKRPLGLRRYNANRYRFVCPQPEFKLGDHLSSERRRTFRQRGLPVPERLDAVGAFENGSSKNLSAVLSGSIFNGHYDGRHMAESAQVVRQSRWPTAWEYQVLALRWVQENINALEVTQRQVTIFGQSAGSMSVGGAGTIAPGRRPLPPGDHDVRGAHSYLGSEPARKSLNKTLDLAEKLHCNNNFGKLVSKDSDLSSRKDRQQLLDSTHLALLDGESFIPVYEDCGNFLPTPPVVELQIRKSFHKKGIDLMFGVTSGEGSGFVVPYLPVINSDQIDLKMTRSALGLLFQIFQLPYYQEVEDFYTKGLNDSDKDSLRRAIASSFGDFTSPVRRSSSREALSKSSPHQSPLLLPGAFTAIETKLSADMVRAWTNFAKHGDPGHWEGSGSGNGSSNSVQWRGAFSGADHSSVQFMELNAHHYRMVGGFYQKSCDGFWKAKLFA
ncbi:hypothetical protein TYRP_001547, partial [Tyrophagus putrescentiae]